ncbi:S1 RNA-binding domain-containing protein [Candidatus Woesearchaeota archaeon]|nr:S1 RNA-binding domain-containing protein [Candidatus Woesearchaeota archaeon]
MLLSKEGFPQVEELVLCTVTGIQPHSVFCTLDEYGGRTGMIHISEVAPGRIRNIREFVTEGKKVVCRVININAEKGYIDLSLRRVNETQKRQKNNEIKQEQLVEKIVVQYARSAKKDAGKLYAELCSRILKKYPNVFSCFEKIAKGEESLSSFCVEKQVSEQITELIKQRMQPEIIIIEGDLQLSSYAPDGIEQIKEVLVKSCLDTTYRGAGTYHVIVRDEDPKKAEKQLKTGIDILLAEAKSRKVIAQWQRKGE